MMFCRAFYLFIFLMFYSFALAKAQSESLSERHRAYEKAKSNVVVIVAKNKEGTIIQPLFTHNNAVIKYFPRLFISSGTGVIIDQKGTILTHASLVAGADEIIVKLNDKDVQATLLAVDEETQIAMLQIAVAHLPAIELVDINSLNNGDWLMSLGIPFGTDYSFFQGTINYINKTAVGYDTLPFIHTDISTNLLITANGVFDQEGNLVGIMLGSIPQNSVNIVFPIHEVINLFSAQKKNNKQPLWLGIQLAYDPIPVTVFPTSQEVRGMRVDYIVPNSPAAISGVQAGDIILKFNDQSINGSKYLLTNLVQAIKAGDSMTIELLRHNQVVLLPIMPAIRSKHISVEPKNTDPLSFYENYLGFKAEDMPLNKGVRITAITDNPAINAGLFVNDIIIVVNDRTIYTRAELNMEILQSKANIDAIIQFIVLRDGYKILIPLSIR